MPRCEGSGGEEGVRKTEWNNENMCGAGMNEAWGKECSKNQEDDDQD